jgi:cardiolipin synthase
VGGVIVLYVAGQPPPIRPILLSKANTVLQIALAGVALLMAGFGMMSEGLLEALIVAVAASTLGSGAVYVWRAAGHPR